MTYKGYEIVLERQQFEVWSLTDDGEPIEFLKDCDHHYELGFWYVVRDDKETDVSEHDTFEQAKAWIDRTTMTLNP